MFLLDAIDDKRFAVYARDNRVCLFTGFNRKFVELLSVDRHKFPVKNFALRLLKKSFNTPVFFLFKRASFSLSLDD